eukprot:m.173971 g.173971  ORF g.173971 m.173971 type:complete len:76 (+) comp16745_c0_seq17:2719-2946(+)
MKHALSKACADMKRTFQSAQVVLLIIQNMTSSSGRKLIATITLRSLQKSRPGAAANVAASMSVQTYHAGGSSVLR